LEVVLHIAKVLRLAFLHVWCEFLVLIDTKVVDGSFHNEALAAIIAKLQKLAKLLTLIALYEVEVEPIVQQIVH